MQLDGRVFRAGAWSFHLEPSAEATPRKVECFSGQKSRHETPRGFHNVDPRRVAGVMGLCAHHLEKPSRFSFAKADRDRGRYGA